MNRITRRDGLRRRLFGLMSIFAVFAVSAAAVTIYGTQAYMARATRDFEEAVGWTSIADRVVLTLRQQILMLEAMLRNEPGAERRYFETREEFQILCAQLRPHLKRTTAPGPPPPTLRMADRLTEVSDRFLTLLSSERNDDARALLEDTIKGKLVPELTAEITRVKTELDKALHRTSRRLETASTEVLLMTLTLGALAGGLVIVGTTLMRRWLFQPIETLQTAARRFAEGDLDHRVTPRYDDELGALGRAMNGMAESIARVQSALRASEAKHRQLFRNLRDAVLLVDEDGVVVEYHDSDAGLLGVEGTEPVGKPMWKVWPQWRRTGQAWETIIAAAIRDGRRYRAMDVEWSAAPWSEQSFRVDILVYRVEYGSHRHAAVVLRDVSERVDLHRKLRQAETMEAVGTLASGLAHDFNNLLAGVIGTLSLLENELTREAHAERVRSAIRMLWQASGLSRRLLNFAGSAHGEPQVFRLAEAVRTIVQSLDPSFLEGIDLETDLEEDAAVRMDRDHFTQTLLNLLRNARDAMPDGGRLRIALETTTARSPHGGRAELPFAVLIVSDSGCGMTPDVQSRIFEPFFTTKTRASQRGRGMGMAIVYAAVRNAGGFIRLESEPLRGTTFRVYLPVAESSTTDEDVRPVRPPRTSTTLLLLDPDAGVRETVTQMLEQEGYTVLQASSAEEVLFHLDADQAVDLLLADAEALRDAGRIRHAPAQQDRPSPPVVLLTTTGLDAHDDALPPELHVIARLEKPFDPHGLIRIVRQAVSTEANRDHPAEPRL
ncbi:MAG: HAMP domain-containing protein [Planctomycetota bacterium]|nr:MAG: HAMP domain-containing protein [Planctomycetota bacterium]